MENEVRSGIPNTAFDMEYRTQWRDEVDFLAERGIYYTIRRREGEYGIPTYKYTRTAELFLALADFYLHRRPNAKSKATFKGYPKPEGETKFRPRVYRQESFLDKDNNIRPQYDNKQEQTAEQTDKATEQENPAENATEPNVFDLDKIKEARRILEEAESQVGKEKLKILTMEGSSDDTE